MDSLNAKDLHKKLKDFQKKCLIVDVRSPEEFEEEHIDGAINIPLDEIPKKSKTLKKDKELILVCLSGLRAQKAGAALESVGFKVKVLNGGMIEWRRALGPAYFAKMFGGEGEE